MKKQQPKRGRLAKSVRVYIRKQKARIRRTQHDDTQQRASIAALRGRFRPKH